MKWFDNTSLTLVIIGAVNWLLIGIFRFDLVAFLFGNMSWLSRIIYTIVGLCGLYLSLIHIFFHFHLQKFEAQSFCVLIYLLSPVYPSRRSQSAPYTLSEWSRSPLHLQLQKLHLPVGSQISYILYPFTLKLKFA